jgi:hypothetical protein
VSIRHGYDAIDDARGYDLCDVLTRASARLEAAARHFDKAETRDVASRPVAS